MTQAAPPRRGPRGARNASRNTAPGPPTPQAPLRRPWRAVAAVCRDAAGSCLLAFSLFSIIPAHRGGRTGTSHGETAGTSDDGRLGTSGAKSTDGDGRTGTSHGETAGTSDDGRLGRPRAGRAIAWLPVTGLALALPTAAVMAGVDWGGNSAARRLLAATLAVAMMALLTGGLHLDGLADTADGLGSRRPRDEALAIMRRPDIGPFGVVTLVLVMLVQISALATIAPGWASTMALVTAAVTGRVAAVLATGPGSPAARPEGFGALVTASTTTATRAAIAGALLALAAGAGVVAGGWPAAARAAGAALAGLFAAELLRRLALRRLGGMTGDVFGALIETGTATVVLVLALS